MISDLSNLSKGWWGIVGHIPALMPTYKQQLTVGVGYRVAFIHLHTGVQTEFADSENLDPVTSSTVMNGNQDFVMFQTSSVDQMTVYHVSFTGNGNTTPPYTTAAYRCAYHAGETSCNSPTFVSPDSAAPGGFPQPTTYEQVIELHSAILSLHTMIFGAEATAASLATPFPSHLPFTIANSGRLSQGVIAPPILGEDVEGILATLRVARLAREIPEERLHAIVTPSGYTRQSKGGILNVLGSYPTGSISLRPGDQSALFMHYQEVDGKDALFEIDTGGHVVIAEATGLPGFSFENARSSPAIDVRTQMDEICMPFKFFHPHTTPFFLTLTFFRPLELATLLLS